MMGTQAVPERLFYDFCLEDHVPDNHLVHRALSVGIGRDQAGIDGKPFAIPRPPARQRRTTVSNTWRKRLLCRKRVDLVGGLASFRKFWAISGRFRFYPEPMPCGPGLLLTADTANPATARLNQQNLLQSGH